MEIWRAFVEYNDHIDAYRSYNYIQEILFLVARVIITIAIEMAVALCFGFRKKKQLLVLVSVNVIIFSMSLSFLLSKRYCIAQS